MLESRSGTYAFEVPRNWKQTLTIFWLLPAWSSELETGMSHFFGVARVEFRVEFPGSASTCPGQVRRNFRQWSTGQLENFFAEVVGLDDNLDIFFAGKNSPWRRLGRAPMPGRWRGREAMPGRHQAEPSQSPAPLLYVLYVLYLTRQATEQKAHLRPLMRWRKSVSTLVLEFL